MQMLPSRISGMEWWNGIVEWNGGMEYTLMHLLIDKFTYSFALQLIIWTFNFNNLYPIGYIIIARYQCHSLTWYVATMLVWILRFRVGMREVDENQPRKAVRISVIT